MIKLENESEVVPLKDEQDGSPAVFVHSNVSQLVSNERRTRSDSEVDSDDEDLEIDVESGSESNCDGLFFLQDKFSSVLSALVVICCVVVLFFDRGQTMRVKLSLTLLSLFLGHLLWKFFVKFLLKLLRVPNRTHPLYRATVKWQYISGWAKRPFAKLMACISAWVVVTTMELSSEVIESVLFSLMVGFGLVVVKDVAVRYTAASYHQVHYFDSVLESTRMQHILTVLLKNKPVKSIDTFSVPKLFSLRQLKMDKKKDLEAENLDSGSQMEALRVANMLFDRDANFLDGKGKSKMVRSSTFAGTSGVGGGFLRRNVSDNSLSELEAKEFKKSKRDGIIPKEKFEYLFGESAEEVFGLFKSKKKQKITRKAMQKAVTEIYKRRSTLEKTLINHNNVFNTIDLFATMFVCIPWILATCGLFGVDLTNAWLLLSSVIVGFSFIFGSSLSRGFNNFLFIVIQHPFDVGDRIFFPSGEHAFVHRIEIMSTVFVTWDGKLLRMPNHELASMRIHNAARGKFCWKSFSFAVVGNTTRQQFLKFKERLGEELAKDPETFKDFDCVISGFSGGKMHIEVWIEYTFRWQHYGRFFHASTRTTLMQLQILHDLQISVATDALRVEMNASGQSFGDIKLPESQKGGDVLMEKMECGKMTRRRNLVELEERDLGWGVA